MMISNEAYRLGFAAHRDGLFQQYLRATMYAIGGDLYAKAWLSGWNNYHD